MCLKLKSQFEKPIIAENDIIVYKAIDKTIAITVSNPSEMKHGDLFEGIINGIKCKGKISINYDSYIYLCSNYKGVDGNDAKDKLGYKYSWMMDEAVQKIIINGELVFLREVVGYQTPYQKAKVKIGETYTSKLIKAYDSIGKGLHSFESIDTARKNSNDDIVAKCIIPKGSEYYKGTFNDNISYASDTLTYVEIIK